MLETRVIDVEREHGRWCRSSSRALAKRCSTPALLRMTLLSSRCALPDSLPAFFLMFGAGGAPGHAHGGTA